jgi:hypothetical protein
MIFSFLGRAFLVPAKKQVLDQIIMVHRKELFRATYEKNTIARVKNTDDGVQLTFFSSTINVISPGIFRPSVLDT